MTTLARSTLFCLTITAMLIAALPAAAETVTIYRDTWGVPSIYADTEEGVCYGMGYAQAEDRPRQIFDNYRVAIGTLAEVRGPGELEKDFVARAFRHAEVSKANYGKVSVKVRGCMEAFQDGVRQYFKDHPDKKPDSYMEIEPWMCVALTRAVIWSWPLGQAGADLVAGGINPPKIGYRGSNEMALAPSKTKSGKPIAVIDPHLGFYGPMRFYEARVYGGKIAMTGTAVTGLPMISLGHSETVSVAMTTGGPDTADVFVETLNPDNPAQYKVDGQWRNGEIDEIAIRVKEKDGDIGTWSQKILHTHHGPCVVQKDGKGYALALSYANEIGLADQMFKLYAAKTIDEVKQALAMAQLMPQNVMVACITGDIYYQRTGRVPIRPNHVNCQRPIPGDDSKNDWQGIHPTSDLVQITNPACGWMQNCNVSPRVMFRDSPLTQDKYKDYIYMEPTFMGIPYGLHQRAAMTFKQLDEVKNATVKDVMEIATSPQVFGVGPWQEALRKAWEGAPDPMKQNKDLAKFVQIILAWNGRAEKDSVGVVCYDYWKKAGSRLSRLRDRRGMPPQGTSDEEILRMVRDGYEKLLKERGTIEVKYGDIYRTGRRGGKRTAPAEGGGVDGIATPRNLGFSKGPVKGQMLMKSGQCSLQVVHWTDPPQSWTIAPLGQADDPTSPHFDDQAIKLVSTRTFKSTYFKDKASLMKNLESKKELTYKP